MLIIIQFPIIDGRLFCNIDRHPLPVWNALSEGVDFIPRFGCAKLQKDFESVPKAWRGDAQYISARWAIRMAGCTEKRNLSDIGATAPRQQPFWVYRPKNATTEFCFTPAFRRVLSDGIGLARIDVGFWVFGGRKIGGTNVLYMIRDLLTLQTEVQQLNGVVERRALRYQAAPLSKLYYLSTRITSSTSKNLGHGESLVRHGAPAIFVDDRMGISDMPRKPRWFVPMARFLETPAVESFPSKATVVPKATAGSLDLAYTMLNMHDTRFAIWMIRGAPPAGPDAAKVSHNLRHCLLRLHATRQALLELQRLATTGLIPRCSDVGMPANFNNYKPDNFDNYVKKLAKQVLSPESYGANQAELQQIISLYDLGEGGGERTKLETAFDNLPMNRQIKERVIEATKTIAHASNNYYAEKIIMTSSGPTSTIIQTGAGSITMGNLTQVSGDYISQSKDIAKTASDAVLRKALDELRERVETLAKNISDSPTQELVTRKLKQLTEEASASKPDKETLKVTGEGLIEAAKTVAEMVGPITTAVKGVLALLGIAL